METLWKLWKLMFAMSHLKEKKKKLDFTWSDETKYVFNHNAQWK